MVVCIYWWNPLKPTPHKNTIRIHRWSATQFPGNILRCHPLIVCSTNIFSPGKHPDCHYHNLSGSGLQTFYKVTGIMEIKMIIIILVETVETVVLIAYCYNGVYYWFIFYFIYLLSHLSEILVNILSPDNSYLFFGPHESGNVFFIEISPIDMFSIKISYIYMYNFGYHRIVMDSFNYNTYIYCITYQLSLTYLLIFLLKISPAPNILWGRIRTKSGPSLRCIEPLVTRADHRPGPGPVCRWPRSASNYDISQQNSFTAKETSNIHKFGQRRWKAKKPSRSLSEKSER